MACILVIDTNPRIRTGVRHILEYAGYEVVEAPDGRAGMRAAQTRGIDLVILDPLAPVSEGVAGMRVLQTVMPAAKMLAITDWRSSEDPPSAPAATLAGAHGTVQKPIGAQDLLATVQALLTTP